MNYIARKIDLGSQHHLILRIHIFRCLIIIFILVVQEISFAKVVGKFEIKIFQIQIEIKNFKLNITKLWDRVCNFNWVVDKLLKMQTRIYSKSGYKLDARRMSSHYTAWNGSSRMRHKGSIVLGVMEFTFPSWNTTRTIICWLTRPVRKRSNDELRVCKVSIYK